MAGEVEQEWLRPERISEAPQPAAGDVGTGFELRPLSLGEILDRTFALYRSRFWLFAGIATVSASVQVAVQAISLTTAHTLMRTIAPNGPGRPAMAMPFHGFVAAQLGTYVASLVFFLVLAVTQAATSLAMSEVYLRRPVDAKTALLAAGRRWYRWIAIAIWQVGSMIWIPLLALVPGSVLAFTGTRSGNSFLAGAGAFLVFAGIVGGLPAGVVMYLRNALAIPAAVVEGLTVRRAMRRSKGLSRGTKGRLFTVLLIAGCLSLVVGVLESPASLLIVFSPRGEHYLAEVITLLISFLGRTVVAPVALIGLTLVYFDRRVRGEAFDLEVLLEGHRAIASPLSEVAADDRASGVATLE